jgi:hypothetical protein
MEQPDKPRDERKEIKAELYKKTLAELEELEKEIKSVTKKTWKREAEDRRASGGIKQVNTEEKNLKAPSGKEIIKPASKVSMVPLFSKLSIIVICIGLIIGLGLGLAYWAFSPAALVEEEEPANASAGFLQSIGIGPPPPTEPWMSKTNIQVVNPGSTFTSIGQLANVGIYYAAKAKSLPFLQFLSLDLEKYTPLYNHTVAELDKIISAKYDSNLEQPTIVLQVITPTADEATFLINHIPQVFQSFLIAEENEQRGQSKENILQSIEEVKKAIIEAEKEVSLLEAEGIFSIDKDPTYVAYSTRVAALELELARQANAIATVAYYGTSENGDIIKQEYENTLKEIEQAKIEILLAEQKASSLDEQISNIDYRNEPRYLRLTAEVASLQSRINTIMNGGVGTDGRVIVGLAEMIVAGDVTSPAYQEANTKLITASLALSESQKEIAKIESQFNQEQRKLTLDYQVAQSNVNILNTKFTTLVQKLGTLATDNITSTAQKTFELTSAALVKARQDLASVQAKLVSSQLPKDLDYQVARAKVDTLNIQLTTLNNNLSATFVNTGSASQAISSLAVGNPSQAEIVFPVRIKARNALAIGGILGIVIAWAVLNRKWLVKMFGSSNETAESA